MKKLMIAAFAATTVGAFASNNCTPAPVVPGDCATVYSIKMSVKTTKGVLVTGSQANGSTCAPGSTDYCLVYRTKDSTTFTGYFAECDCACGILDGATAYMWDSKRKASLDGAAFTTTLLNVMGKKQTEAEWAWTFAATADYGEQRTQAYALTGAGIGKFDVKNARYTSFSGNFAGTVGAPYDLKAKGSSACVCDPSQVAKCDALEQLSSDDSVAYGTWTVKYNSSLSKKFAVNGASVLPLPSYY
ncbi:MAG: hypothetical protein ACI4Q3_01085 [Kiritimatiellia bacterium]